MPILLILLALGVLTFLWYRRRTTALTRDCRWRMDKTQSQWRCAFCGAEQSGLSEPKTCLRR